MRLCRQFVTSVVDESAFQGQAGSFGPGRRASRYYNRAMDQLQQIQARARARGVDIGRRYRFPSIACLVLTTCLLATSCYDNIMPTAGPNGITSCKKGGVCQSDGGSLTVYRGNLGPAMGSATYMTLFGSYDTTNLAPVFEVSSPTESGPGETDIIFKYYSAPSSVYGRAECDDPSIGNDRCDSFYVYFNMDFLNAHVGASWYTTFTQALACHEIGHAVGLTHGFNANPVISNQNESLHCMRTDMYAWGQDDPTLGTHNVDMINSVY